VSGHRGRLGAIRAREAFDRRESVVRRAMRYGRARFAGAIGRSRAGAGLAWAIQGSGQTVFAL